MFIISAALFDTAGILFIHHPLSNSSWKSRSRRVERSALTNGGVYIDDRGYTDGDRTITIEARCTADDFFIATRLLELHPRLFIATPDNELLHAAPQTLTNSGATLQMQFMAVERVA